MSIKNVYIKTWGCAANKAESEIIGGLLSRSGFIIVSSPELADILILNTCGVKESTKNKILNYLKGIKKKYPNKIIVVCGCLPEIDYESIKRFAPDVSIVSTNYITKIQSIIKKIISGRRVEMLGKAKHIKLGMPRIKHNKVVHIVPICSGCRESCSYCATKLAKGDLFSYPPSMIVEEIKRAKQSGAKEFWLTGQDVGSYGLDFEFSFGLPELLETILEEIRGKYFIRVGMINPKYAIKYITKLPAIFSHENIFKFLHIPLQSGSNSILKKMRRDYRVEDFIKVVETFRKRIPEITIWTDIIVGFPGETEKDFEKTKKVIQRVKPDWVNVSRFSSHPNTLAHRMKQINSEIKKERSRILSEIVRKIAAENNKRWMSWEGEILIDEYKREKTNYIGRNYTYKPIVVVNRKVKLGDFVKVKIKETKSTCLIGHLI